MDSFNSLVEEYKSRNGVANIFGVILFTNLNPNIKKVLRDEDYWQSYEEITGDRFCVFSVKPIKGEYAVSSPPEGLSAFMIPIWKEPSENKKLLKLFELEDTKNLPMLLLFTHVQGEYLKIELKLDDSTQDSAQNSIKEQLEFCVNVLSLIRKENLKNSSGLYDAIKLYNNDRLVWKILNSGVNCFSKLKSLVS